MSLVQVIYDKLTATAAVTNLVGTRIYLTEAPQNPTLPYVVYRTISSVRSDTFDGPDGHVDTRVQFDAYDTMTANAGQLSVIAIANAIRTALSGFRGTVDGTRLMKVLIDGDADLSEPDTRIARRTFDARIHHD